MKNRLLWICFLFVVLGAAVPVSAAPSGRGLIFGINAGISPTVWFYNAYRFGVEAGFRFSERLALVAEASYGSTTYKSSAGWQESSYTNSAKTTYTVLPVSLTLYYFAPVSDRLAVCLGFGGGDYSLSIKTETETKYLSYNPETTTETEKARAYAPHICLGFEYELLKKVMIIGEVRQSAGKTKISTTDPYGFKSEQDISFGGIQVKIGLRVYLGGSDNS
jgi:hypothetical protein